MAQEALPGQADADVAGLSTAIAEINAAIPLPLASTANIDVALVDPFDLPFQELLERIRDRYLAPSPLVADATDISVILDQQRDHDIVRVQFGPMMPEQLQRDFLSFARENVPPQFLFVYLRRTLVIEPPGLDVMRFLEELAPTVDLALARAAVVSAAIA